MNYTQLYSLHIKWWQNTTFKLIYLSEGQPVGYIWGLSTYTRLTENLDSWNVRVVCIKAENILTFRRIVVTHFCYLQGFYKAKMRKFYNNSTIYWSIRTLYKNIWATLITRKMYCAIIMASIVHNRTFTYH